MLTLVAPTSAVQGTFASWSVHVPKDWAVLATEGGNMMPKDQPMAHADLGSLMHGVVMSWRWVIERGLPPEAYYGAGVAVLVILLVTLFVRRSALPRVAVMLAVVAALCVGIRATSAPAFNKLAADDDLRTITYTRALSLEDESAMTVVVSVVPAWRRHATFYGALVVPAVGLACLVLALIWRRIRPVLLAFGLVGLIYGAAQFPACTRALGHLSTWGIAALLLIWFVRRGFMYRRTPAGAPAAAMLLLGLLLLPGCVSLPEQMTVERAEYQLKAERDSMAVSLRLRVTSPGPASIPLLEESGVLLTPEKISDDVEMEREHGNYVLKIKRRGLHEIHLKFLSPLAEAGDDQVRHFRLACPSALTTRVELAIPTTSVDVTAPTAMHFTKEETDDATIARALLGPGDDIFFIWKPRARERKLEATSFFAELMSVMRFDAGLAEGRHRIRFQIAQGELKEIRARVPENMTVTAVAGDHLGAWRFDPADHELEVHLTKPVGGEYVLMVTTQVSYDDVPSTVSVTPLHVQDALYQRGILGLMTSPAVYITPKTYGQPMNLDDFTREASSLLSTTPSEAAGTVRHAYRVQRLDETLTVQVSEVRPEIRARETAVFTVSDERLVYNGTLEIHIAKAGLFSVDLRMPDGYDIDALGAEAVSHWDETVSEGRRTVQVHFKKRLLGTVRRAGLQPAPTGVGADVEDGNRQTSRERPLPARGQGERRLGAPQPVPPLSAVQRGGQDVRRASARRGPGTGDHRP